MERGDILGVMSELHHGMKLANKLKKQLHNSNISDSNCAFLIQEIVSCYDNALALLDSQESTHLLHFKPTTEEDFKNHVVVDVPKKRKSLSRWSEEVVEDDQDEDGYNWRKYGQKDILGATHPRSYYRCTHRHTQGCLATKQVQRGEDDARRLKIIYRGKHSCVAKQDKQNVKAQQLNHENIPTQPLSEPTYFSNNLSFLDSDSFLPLGDLDFLIDDEVDFDARLVEACHVQG